MSKLEIFQNGTSLHPDTMGDPVFQIGSKNEDGSYAVVVFEGMTESQAKAKLAEMQPVKSKPKAEAPKKKAPTKDAEKAKAKKKTTKKKASTKKKKNR